MVKREPDDADVAHDADHHRRPRKRIITVRRASQRKTDGRDANAVTNDSGSGNNNGGDGCGHASSSPESKPEGGANGTAQAQTQTQGSEGPSAQTAFWHHDACLRALARAVCPSTPTLRTLTHLSRATYEAAMAVRLARLELNRRTTAGIYDLLMRKRHLAAHVRELALSDDWGRAEIWVPASTSVAASFAQFWPSIRPFGQLADIFSMVGRNEGLRIDVVVDFWCLKALYEVCRAQRSCAARIGALRIKGGTQCFVPPSAVPSHERQAYVQEFEDVMWHSLTAIIHMASKLVVFQLLPEVDSKHIVRLPVSVAMSLADFQSEIHTLKLVLLPAHRYALLSLCKHYWHGLASLSMSFVNSDEYAAEMREVDAWLGKKWLDLTELRILYSGGHVSDVLKWSWSHPQLQVLEADVSKATAERVVRFVQEHHDIEHLSLRSEERCKPPARYPPKLRSCCIVLGATAAAAAAKDPFAAALESGAGYITVALRGRAWQLDVPSAPWADQLGTITALDLLIDVDQFTTVCSFFLSASTASRFAHLLELCIITDRFKLGPGPRWPRTEVDCFRYALEHLRGLPRIQAIALNSSGDALEIADVRARVVECAPTLRAAAWLTSSAVAQVFGIQPIPLQDAEQFRFGSSTGQSGASAAGVAALLKPVSPFRAGLSRLACGHDEQGWPFDHSFFLHAPTSEGPAAVRARSSMVDSSPSPSSSRGAL